MIDKDRVLLGESVNSGHNVFLHYDAETDYYLAFGRSAYYATLFISPEVSFSDELQMPVARMDKGEVQLLQSHMMLIEHTHNRSIHFYAQRDIDQGEYERWAEKVKSEK